MKSESVLQATTLCALRFLVRYSQTYIDATTSERTSSTSSAPVYWQWPHCLCSQSRRKERESSPEKQGRKEEGV